MIITKMALPRRTFLRGMGATLALPLLDAMVPALSRAGQDGRRPGAPPRLHLHAERRDDERVDAERRRARRSTSCRRRSARSRRFKDQVRRADRPEPAAGRVVRRRQRRALARPDGVAERRPPEAHRRRRRPKRGTTVDQIAAQALGKDTPLLSLELALEPNYLVGNCDNGYSCVYRNTISWRTPTTPLPMEVNPRVVFERLFGDGGTPGAAAGADARGPQHPRLGDARRSAGCRVGSAPATAPRSPSISTRCARSSGASRWPSSRAASR